MLHSVPAGLALNAGCKITMALGMPIKNTFSQYNSILLEVNVETVQKNLESTYVNHD